MITFHLIMIELYSLKFLTCLQWPGWRCTARVSIGVSAQQNHEGPESSLSPCLPLACGFLPPRDKSLPAVPGLTSSSREEEGGKGEGVSSKESSPFVLRGKSFAQTSTYVHFARNRDICSLLDRSLTSFTCPLRPA